MPLPAAPATTIENRFVTLEEERRRRAEQDLASDERPAILQIAVLAMLLFATIGVLWYFMQPPSADKLYGRIVAAAQDEDPVALMGEQDDVRNFLDRFPNDPRAGDIRHYQDEIELERLEQRFHIRARFPGREDQLTPVEHDYLEAVSYETSDPQQAADKLRALVQLYGPAAQSSDHTKLCVELAQRKLESFQSELAKDVADRKKVLDASLRRAEQVRIKDPAEARSIWQSIVELYGNKSWAADGVAKAKAALSQSTAQQPATPASDHTTDVR